MTPRSDESGWRWHLAAGLLYAALAVIFIDHGHSLTNGIIGQGSDPYDFIWTLAWWPWALAHHADPLQSGLMWQPVGVCLMWVASLPLLSLLGLPLTLLSGPVLTYNVWILVAPPLCAWFAYRLCLRVVGQPVPALIGGYLFGFSSYEMAQDTAALNLSVTFLVPALLWLVLKRLDDELSRRRTVLLASVILVSQFLIGTEVFTAIFFFGGIAWLLALAYLPARRPVLWRLLVDGLIAGPFVALVISPFLISMIRHADYLNLPTAWSYYFTADALNLIIPGPENLFRGWFGPLAVDFRGGIAEIDAYVGLPLLAIIYLYARRHGAAGAGRFLVVMLASLLILSLGPVLWIANHYTGLPLPWSVLVRLPVFSFMLPARFALFSSLVAALIAASWLARPGPGPARLALALLACVTLLPKPTPWLKRPDIPFFAPGNVSALLGPQSRLLILPFAIQGPSSYWQAQSGFDFIETGGYVGFPPRAMQHYKAVGELFGADVDDLVLQDFSDFAQATATQYIVAGPGTPAALLAKIARLNWPRRDIEGVVLFTVPRREGG